MFAVNHLVGFGAGAAVATPTFVNATAAVQSGSGDLVISTPAGSQTGDLLLMTAVGNGVPTPSGWTEVTSYAWTTYGYPQKLFKKISAGEASATFTAAAQCHAVMCAYRGASDLGTIGSWSQSADGAGITTLVLSGITPQEPTSLIVGAAFDRDNIALTKPAAFTSRTASTGFFWGWSWADVLAASISGGQTWTQDSTLYTAVGLLFEVKGQ